MKVTADDDDDDDGTETLRSSLPPKYAIPRKITFQAENLKIPTTTLTLSLAHSLTTVIIIMIGIHRKSIR